MGVVSGRRSDIFVAATACQSRRSFGARHMINDPQKPCLFPSLAGKFPRAIVLLLKEALEDVFAI
jgi:hypothetical protein